MDALREAVEELKKTLTQQGALSLSERGARIAIIQKAERALNAL